MGMQHTVNFDGPPPTWIAVRDLLGQNGVALQMRMIDGQLAFPDEEPGEPWQELRVATAAGMVTLRRGTNQVDVIVWGNADPALTELWNNLAGALAEAGQGTIKSGDGTTLTASEFRARLRK